MKDISYSSRHFFEKAMRGHEAVLFLNRMDGDVYRIERTFDRPPLTVLIADIYIMGQGDVYEISSEYDGIESIVLVGFYNRYSCDAKETAKDNGIALFTLNEFFGALHRTGKSFLDYVPRSKENSWD